MEMTRRDLLRNSLAALVSVPLAPLLPVTAATVAPSPRRRELHRIVLEVPAFTRMLECVHCGKRETLQTLGWWRPSGVGDANKILVRSAECPCFRQHFFERAMRLDHVEPMKIPVEPRWSLYSVCDVPSEGVPPTRITVRAPSATRLFDPLTQETHIVINPSPALRRGCWEGHRVNWMGLPYELLVAALRGEVFRPARIAQVYWK